jgi:ribonuclease HI
LDEGANEVSMAEPIQIWTCAAFHPAFRCGGWAGVRLVQGQVSGVAGGERNTTASRMALAGMVAALRDLPAGATTISVQSNSPDLAAFADLLAGAEAEPPTEDLDLWAQIATAAKGRRLTLVRMPIKPETPLAFAAAWADLARDKAKDRGAFTTPIPKPNLAKVPGLA